jgi:hypothetical protein
LDAVAAGGDLLVVTLAAVRAIIKIRSSDPSAVE